MKCDLCNQPEAHFYLNKRMCIYHYSIQPNRINTETKRERFLELKKCSICGDMAKTEKHHVNYFPEQIQQVCYHCHALIHKGKPYPESKTFYKGVIE